MGKTNEIVVNKQFPDTFSDHILIFDHYVVIKHIFTGIVLL